MILIVCRASDSWGEMARQAGLVLLTGVRAVCVLDPGTNSVVVYPADEEPRSLKRDEELSFPGIVPGFSIRVGEFFE